MNKARIGNVFCFMGVAAALLSAVGKSAPLPEPTYKYMAPEPMTPYSESQIINPNPVSELRSLPHNWNAFINGKAPEAGAEKELAEGAIKNIIAGNDTEDVTLGPNGQLFLMGDPDQVLSVHFFYTDTVSEMVHNPKYDEESRQYTEAVRQYDAAKAEYERRTGYLYPNARPSDAHKEPVEISKSKEVYKWYENPAQATYQKQIYDQAKKILSVARRESFHKYAGKRVYFGLLLNRKLVDKHEEARLHDAIHILLAGGKVYANPETGKKRMLPLSVDKTTGEILYEGAYPVQLAWYFSKADSGDKTEVAPFTLREQLTLSGMLRKHARFVLLPHSEAPLSLLRRDTHVLYGPEYEKLPDVYRAGVSARQYASKLPYFSLIREKIQKADPVLNRMLEEEINRTNVFENEGVDVLEGVSGTSLPIHYRHVIANRGNNIIEVAIRRFADLDSAATDSTKGRSHAFLFSLLEGVLMRADIPIDDPAMRAEDLAFALQFLSEHRSKSDPDRVEVQYTDPKTRRLVSHTYSFDTELIRAVEFFYMSKSTKEMQASIIRTKLTRDAELKKLGIQNAGDSPAKYGWDRFLQDQERIFADMREKDRAHIRSKFER